MVTIWNNVDKPTTNIGGLSFNEIAITFNEAIDEETGSVVYFNGLGTGQIWINETKN
jgi:hypothetical protein